MGFLDDKMNDWEDGARRLDRSFLPTDPALMKLAHERAGHISLSAVAEEYDRLVEAKLSPKRSFLSRLFGK